MQLLENVKIICKETKITTEIDKESFEVELIDNRKKNMGCERYYVAYTTYELDCAHEIDIRLGVWEYPEGVIECEDRNAGSEHDVIYTKWG